MNLVYFSYFSSGANLPFPLGFANREYYREYWILGGAFLLIILIILVLFHDFAPETGTLSEYSGMISDRIRTQKVFIDI